MAATTIRSNLPSLPHVNGHKSQCHSDASLHRWLVLIAFDDVRRDGCHAGPHDLPQPAVRCKRHPLEQQKGIAQVDAIPDAMEDAVIPSSPQRFLVGLGECVPLPSPPLVVKPVDVMMGLVHA
eukprot:scaffold257077_cov21-Prasinocladus_malaysianus.AAC.3